MTARRLLAIDTSGTNALVALSEADGTLLTERRWTAGYRHGEELLTRIDEMLTAAAVSLAELGGIIIGTGPGAFTGLRVGLATAKALARGLDIPIAGVPTSEALLLAASPAIAIEGTQAAQAASKAVGQLNAQSAAAASDAEAERVIPKKISRAAAGQRL